VGEVMTQESVALVDCGSSPLDVRRGDVEEILGFSEARSCGADTSHRRRVVPRVPRHRAIVQQQLSLQPCWVHCTGDFIAIIDCCKASTHQKLRRLPEWRISFASQRVMQLLSS
jgi:hypothetical protein